MAMSFFSANVTARRLDRAYKARQHLDCNFEPGKLFFFNSGIVLFCFVFVFVLFLYHFIFVAIT